MEAGEPSLCFFEECFFENLQKLEITEIDEGKWLVGMWKNWDYDQKTALRIVVIYIIISFLWIFFSDFTIKKYPYFNSEWVEVTKGCLFIFITGLIFYHLIKKGIKASIESEAKYRLIVENVSDLIAVIDKNGTLEYVSPSHQTIIGFTDEELVGKSVFEFIKLEDSTKLKERIQDVEIQQERDPAEFNLKHKDGHFVLVEGKGVPLIEDTGEVDRIIFFSRDITEQKNAERRLVESEERYRRLVEFSPETTIIHIDGKIIFVNKAGLELVGADKINQIIGKNIFQFIPQEYWELAESQMKKVQDGISEITEFKIVRFDGTLIYAEILGFLTTYHGEEAVQIIVRDVTEKKKSAEQVNYLAYYDSLTGIPNRNFLHRYLGEVIENKQTIAVMFLDLDRFKMINDTYGHGFGDFLLQKVTSRLNQCLGEEATLFRYGGDEYVIVLEACDPNNVAQLAEKLIKTLSSPFLIQERQTFISTSIGISVYPKDGDNVETLIQNADTAMYSAKENGKNNYKYYSASLNITNTRKMEIEIGLRKAIETKEFTLYYQPQVHLATKNIIGLEALIRWKHPEHGFISPAEFISVAEETDLIVGIGNWVLKTACEQCKRWLETGFPIQSMAVNVSPIQFLDKNFVSTISEILQDTKLDPSYLDLEITESVTRNVEDATKIMKELKALGIHLSIDDFGTGYSSLSKLRHFPIDKLKIDKSFVDEINVNLNGEAIVRTIIELGSRLGFKVIAEGVENEHQTSFLQENNCHLGQGYFFSKPLPSGELENLLKTKLFS